MKEKIIKNLKDGNYRIEYREYCNCRFNWCLENDELVCDIVSNDGDCWIDNVLIMDDLAGQRDDTLRVGNEGIIACYDAHLGLTVFLRKASQDVLQHIYFKSKKEIVNAIKDSDAYQKLTAGIHSPDANNDLHDKRKREALAKWLEKQNYWRC